MIRIATLGVLFLISGASFAKGPSASYDLFTPANLRLVNTEAKAVNYHGRRALELTPLAGKENSDEDMLAVLTGPDFKDGTIEVEVAGAPRKDAREDMRGFIGIAFRVQGESEKFDCFYLRPSNGRADDQLRRNHALQYISSPEWGWKRLRTENPGQYESYADLVAGEWTRIKIVVNGSKAQLFVNGAAQPALIVNDLKQGTVTGKIALWSHTSTEGYFSRLAVH
jgi:hypothetical protein